MNLWHAYSTVDDGNHILLVVGPVDEKEARGDGQNWEDGYLDQGPYSKEPVMFDFISSFDHEPSDTERIHLVPEEYREAYATSDVESLDLNIPSGGIDEVEFSPEELKAISLAFQDRIPLLQEIVDRRRALGGIQDIKVIRACEDQIECLLRVSDKLELTAEGWDIDE